MKNIKFAFIILLFLTTACSYQASSSTTTTNQVQASIDFPDNNDFYPLLYGEKRIYNEEIKRQTLINTNIDISSIDYLFIEYSIYHVMGNHTISFIVTKESIENGFVNDVFDLSLDEQTIKIKTKETIKHLILTPVILDKTE